MLTELVFKLFVLLSIIQVAVLIVIKLINLIQMYLMVDLMVGLQVILQHLKLSVLLTDQDHLLMQNLFLKYLMTVHSVAQNLFLNQFASQGDVDDPSGPATVVYAPEEDLTVRITLAELPVKVLMGMLVERVELLFSRILSNKTPSMF